MNCMDEKKFIIEITKMIGKLHLKYFPNIGKLNFQTKSEYFNDIVTEVDKAAEKLVIDELKKSGYSGKLLMEESGEIKFGGEDTRIIIDSLDGTFFYSKGLSNFCVATSLEHKGKIILSTVFNPVLNEFFMAEKGKGSFLNGKRIKVSDSTDIKKSTIILSAFPNHEIGKLEKIFVNMMTTGGLRLLGHVLNLNLCYIASGRYDGCISFYSNLPIWDKCSGMLILREAGGMLTDFNGDELRDDAVKFIASNGKIHKEMLNIVK